MQTVFLIYYLLIINVLAFVLYGVDKRRAVRNEYMIKEGVLLWMARLGGGIGSWLGIICCAAHIGCDEVADVVFAIGFCNHDIF